MSTKILKGQYTSVWEHGSITTYAECNMDTGEIIDSQAVDLKNLGHLNREYFKDRAGNEYEVCTTCHEYLLRPAMNQDNAGKGLHEEMTCPNPDCEYNEE